MVSVCAEPSIAAGEQARGASRMRRDLPICCPDPADSAGTRRHHPLSPATTNPAAHQKFPRKGASRLHPHPPRPTGPGPAGPLGFLLNACSGAALTVCSSRDCTLRSRGGRIHRHRRRYGRITAPALATI